MRRRPRPRARRTSSSSSRSSLKMSCWNSYDVISRVDVWIVVCVSTRGSESFTGASASLGIGTGAGVGGERWWWATCGSRRVGMISWGRSRGHMFDSTSFRRVDYKV